MSHIYTPYTYLIGWSQQGLFYYGSRSCKDANPSDFWVKYFTSSNHVKKARMEFGEPDIIQIRKTFSTGKAARSWELKVLRRLKVVRRADFLNKTDRCGIKSLGEPLSPEHKQNISNGLQGKVFISEEQKQQIRKSNATREVSDNVRLACAKTAKLEATRLAVVQSNKTRIISDETRAKLAESARKRNSDPVFIEQRKAGMKAKKA